MSTLPLVALSLPLLLPLPFPFPLSLIPLHANTLTTSSQPRSGTRTTPIWNSHPQTRNSAVKLEGSSARRDGRSLGGATLLRWNTRRGGGGGGCSVSDKERACSTPRQPTHSCRKRAEYRCHGQLGMRLLGM
ncbi:hypothetical protein BDV95DRAFT_561288 [Massariosphaeria phaeospora]|uniref:Ig-like domain-containing protein n=1 Tax=Massariosphaeria phaeospora TaxID=100035 RepID=A0A7C8MC29_9PLEO|nr:hypothetical protein BDV95DRAFT_561288 [Massariosphaeria phaeospora]